MVFTESITVLKDYPKVSGGWRGMQVTLGDLGMDLCEIVLALGGGVRECGCMVGSLATVSARAWCEVGRLILICCLTPEKFWSEVAGMRVIQF